MLGAMSLSDARRPARRPLIRRPTLHDFRSYESLDVRFAARLVALTGENGSGKTNLLEALSMFSPGPVRGAPKARTALAKEDRAASAFRSSPSRTVISFSRSWVRAR